MSFQDARLKDNNRNNQLLGDKTTGRLSTPPLATTSTVPLELRIFGAVDSQSIPILIPAMGLLTSTSHFTAVRFTRSFSSPAPLRRRFFTVRSNLTFPSHKAKYYRELEAAMDVVERACRLCLDVKSSLFSSDGRIIEKNDQTPVTVADFGVQALVSLELGSLFPSIPLVAEEDSASVRSNNLAALVVNAVIGNSSVTHRSCAEADVLQAIDRGGKDAFSFGSEPATYWVLDPIDGTRGFLKGSEALYVVGLALVVEGEIVLGVMGCPNWKNDSSDKTGIIMAAHAGCGTWTKHLPFALDGKVNLPSSWARCFVDQFSLFHEARFCIPDSQTWDFLPLSASYNATTNADDIGDKQILLLPTCCGSLCKYLMVASGRASVFILRAKVQTTIKAWDHAVGMICVHEAGGKVTDWKGSRIDLAADEEGRRIIYPSGGVLVTNGNLHDRIIELISCGSTV